MIRKNDIIEGIIIKDGFTISSGDIAIRSNTSIITPGSGTMSIEFKYDDITTNYKVADIETKVQLSEFVKIASKNTMDERYIEVHKDSINLGGIGSGFVYAGPGGELTTSLAGGTISVISVGVTGPTGPGGTINQNEIAFGTGTGITSSSFLKFDYVNRNLISGYNNIVATSSNSSIVGGDYNKISQVSKSIISGGSNNYINYSGYSNITGGQNNTISTAGPYNNNSIIGGFVNLINNDSNGSSIIGGGYNTVSSGGSSIIGGNYNTITTGDNSVILGGNNLILSESNTTLVPTLKIDSVTGSATASVKLLTYGSTKNVEYINLYTEVTYSEITSLISSSSLVPGTLYKITDRGDRGLFFRALSNNILDKKGTRLMLCPTNYLPGIYSGIYNKGVWYPGMTASANQLAIWGGKVWKNNAGISGTASTILALDSNWTLVDKTTYSNGEYEQKQFSIIYDVDNDWIQKQWDGYGNEVGKDYTFMGQQIGTSSWISYNPCDITDWNLTKIILNDNKSYGIGTYSYMNSNICPEGIFNNSTKGNYIKTFRISDNNCSSIYNNRVCIIIYNNTNGGSINDNNLYTIDNNITTNINLFKQSIFGNVSPITFTGPASPLGEITGNNCISIENNISSGDLEIGFNRCIYIRNNTGTLITINTNNNNGNIQYNTTNGGISGNSNNGDISGNSNTGNIFANKNNGQIGGNSNTGSIIRNVNNGWIVSNSSAGTISDTQVNK